MYRPVLALVAVVALAAAAARAQQIPPQAVPSPCRVDTSEALPELEKRKQRLLPGLGPDKPIIRTVENGFKHSQILRLIVDDKNVDRVWL